jgi:hypothetical protein
MPGSGTLQGGWLTPRLANACALQGFQVALVWHLLWRSIRPALTLGCQSSRGPLGLVLDFYHAWVRRLDVAHLNCGGELGAQSRKGSSVANGHGNGQEGITPPPEALVHEKSMAEVTRTHRLRISHIISHLLLQYLKRVPEAMMTRRNYIKFTIPSTHEILICMCEFIYCTYSKLK